MFRLHPLFLCVGVWYCFKGELFLFLLSTLVAIQHECAHAFAAAKLGYRLNKIVLMPFGAVIDGDLKEISLKDEIFVAVCGPLCNLCTAIFFVALWWFAPTMYAFTDTAFYSSLSIALVNLLPAYPLDGGRIFKCALTKLLLEKEAQAMKAERLAEKICRCTTFVFAFLFLLSFVILLFRKTFNPSLFAFALFLLFGAVGSPEKNAVYDKMDLSCRNVLERGVELRRVAVLSSCTVKDALRFLVKGSYLVLEVYDENERHLFDISQNELSELFLSASSPYETLLNLHKKAKKEDFFR